MGQMYSQKFTIKFKKRKLFLYIKLGELLEHDNIEEPLHFYPTALKGCQGIVFNHGVRMGVRAGSGKMFVRAVSQKP